MQLRACIAKIHRATVTEADLNYVGSITIDADLLDLSGMRPYQYVNITSLANGTFWQTYVVAGKRGSGQVCLNGPPAHHFRPGDKIIVLAEALVRPAEFEHLDPIIVIVESDDNLKTRVIRHGDVAHG
ncbi:MAG: aspartate 1-decarboxylase [Verrucomicrobiae bacterium]|nr:aspartate 1-decarboxylase [Verrucomicrobiae bacterium]MCP5540962.1 aspartate 1-decarboxylase [Akkermansiaceae bacterium]